MSEPFLIGLVGARGFVGRELIRLIARHPDLMLAYAVSREWAGKPVSDIAPEDNDECIFEALDPDTCAKRRADVVVLAMPDGAAEPYIEALDRHAPQRIIVDLSADKRFDDAWTYGLPEHNRERIARARRIANPGCYATAMQLSLKPLVPMFGGTPSVFGVSGYSGAGTKPGPRNDEGALAENLMPYALAGHKHEREATRHLGAPVRFMPHVHPAFRGLTVTANVPFAAPIEQRALRRLFDEAYGAECFVTIQDDIPQLRSAVEKPDAVIGGLTISEDGTHIACVCAIDNLLKGAASQAVQNINLSLGLEETLGLL
ncbi:MAG: N-acetyl-gamma-glutamyl-phosphate reductase [Pseudomonadota bacterium]